jgi:succinyl-CoA synthetase beta subunit
MSQTKQVKVLLVNLVSGLVPCDEIATVIAAYLKRRVRQPRGVSELRPNALITHTVRLPHLVVRLVGSQCDRASALLEASHTSVMHDLDGAIAKAVSLTELVNGKT